MAIDGSEHAIVCVSLEVEIVARIEVASNKENTEADSLTNEIFTGFEESARIRLKWEDIELDVLNALVQTRAQFDAARESAREAAKLEPKSSKKRYDKSQW